MRSNKWCIGSVLLLALVAGAGTALADTAATVEVDNQTSFTTNSVGANACFGWRFGALQEITITHLGLLDLGDDGLINDYEMGIWRLLPEGGAELLVGSRVSIASGTAPDSDSHVYAALPEPITLTSGQRYLVGAYTPTVAWDALIILSPGRDVAYAIAADDAGVIDFETSLLRYRTDFDFPWGATTSYIAVNFQYTTESPTPVAEAGEDVDIYSSEQDLPETIIEGAATDPYPGPEDLTYRWLEGETVLQDWADVAADGAADLCLEPAPSLSLGGHTLTLEVTDGVFTVSDTMTLTIFNTPPEGQVAPTYQEVEINTDVTITGAVADFDGDPVSYQWCKGSEVLDSGVASPPVGGDWIAIPDLTIPAFPLGVQEVQLVVDDGVNPEGVTTATVMVVDTTAPTLTAESSVTMLWPPNHTLRPVTICANTADNGGGAVTLAVEITSNEPGDDDWYVDSIDDATGVIELRLRAERTGSGDGRVYTITVTATDASSNESTSVVEVRVPHDRRKQK